MKKFFLLAAAALLGFTACENAGNAGASLGNAEKINLKTLRAAQKVQDVERFSLSSLQDVKIDELKAEAIVVKQKQQAQDDAALVSSTFKNMMSAKSEAQQLDLKLSMSDAPVENGVFLFSIESKSNQDLTLEMYDEEGFSLAANNKVNLNAGNNYKALNVKDLSTGEYMLRLRDAEGKELKRAIKIQN
jgi:enoyl reductase-like protein